MYEWKESRWTPLGGDGGEIFIDQEKEQGWELEKWEVDTLRNLFDRFDTTLDKERSIVEDEQFHDELRDSLDVFHRALYSDEYAPETLSFIRRYSQHSEAQEAPYYFLEELEDNFEKITEGLHSDDQNYRKDCLELLRDLAYFGDEELKEEVVYVYTQELENKTANSEAILSSINGELYDSRDRANDIEHLDPAELLFQDTLIACIKDNGDSLEKALDPLHNNPQT